MSGNCSRNCESCSENCSEREKESLLARPHDGSKVKKVIGVVSGKGMIELFEGDWLNQLFADLTDKN